MLRMYRTLLPVPWWYFCRIFNCFCFLILSYLAV